MLSLLEPSTKKFPVRTTSVSLATLIHAGAWSDAVDKAAEDKDLRYGLYASRILAVKNPEVYLKADDHFLEAIKSNPGFRKVYFTKDIHSPDLYWRRQQEMTGPSFSFNDVNFDDFRLSSYGDLYPNDFPVLPFLDRRMLPVASTLKTCENKVTELEKAALFYFALKERGHKDSYIIYCEDEHAYICRDKTILRISDLHEVKEIQGTPILVFNEDYVWYPLMGRDDRAKSKRLNEIVATHAKSEDSPKLNSLEADLIKRLRENTAIGSEREEAMATVCSMRSTGIVLDNFHTLWQKANPNESRLLENFGILKQVIIKADSLSPVSAYLAAKSMSHSGPLRLWTISREWIGRTATKNWPKTRDHLWWCSHLEYSIDETFRTGAGHCVTQACNLSSVLTLAGIDHYVLEAGRPRDGLTHHYIFVPECDAIIDDGRIMSSQNTVLYPRETIMGGFLKVILYFNHEGRWAKLIRNNYSGNVSPHEAVEEISKLRQINDDTFCCLSPEGILAISKSDAVSKELMDEHITEGLEQLKEEKWKPIELP